MSIEVINKLKPAEYKYNDKSKGAVDRFTLGVMAQDINKLYPIEKYTVLNKDKDGYFMVDYVQLIAPMIKAIQELTDEVERLKNGTS
jgi:hypothetical protein